MSRNYGLGSRDMDVAAEMGLKAAAERGEMSYSTAATLSERWDQFVSYAKGEGINRMEQITRDAVTVYGRELAKQVEGGDKSAAYAQNLVSAVNSVMAMATRGAWDSVSPTKDAGIEQRSMLRTDAPATLDRTIQEAAVDAAREAAGERGAAVVELCRELGLRSKEASLINAKAALAEARDRGAVTISDGTKGGRERDVPITSERQIETLERAAQAQGNDRSMIPSSESWQQWREGTLRDTREAVQEATGGQGLHDLRAAYACERYADLTGHAAPAAGGQIADRAADVAAREQIADELGHGRTDVMSEYVGGR